MCVMSFKYIFRLCTFPLCTVWRACKALSYSAVLQSHALSRRVQCLCFSFFVFYAETETARNKNKKKRWPRLERQVQPIAFQRLSSSMGRQVQPTAFQSLSMGREVQPIAFQGLSMCRQVQPTAFQRLSKSRQVQPIAFRSKLRVSHTLETARDGCSVVLPTLCCEVQFGKVHTPSRARVERIGAPDVVSCCVPLRDFSLSVAKCSSP